MIPDYHFVDVVLCFLKGIRETCDKVPPGEAIRE